MKLIINGQSQEHNEDISLDTLLTAMSADPEHVAIMVNDEIIRRQERDNVTLTDGDRVEILTMVAGG